MKQIEFGKLCVPYNKQYLEIFGYIPTPTDYIATREKYIEALKKSVEEKVEISTLLKKVENLKEMMISKHIKYKDILN